jgi:subtilisin family serine protease
MSQRYSFVQWCTALALILATFSPLHAQGERFYYKYQDKKLLTEDQTRVAVKFTRETSREDALEVSAGLGIFDMEETREVGVSVYTLRLQPGVVQRSATQNLLALDDVVAVHPVYATRDEGMELYLTDGICVQFLNHVSQREIEDVIRRYDLTVYRRLIDEPYYVFSVPRGADALEVSNQIAEERGILFSHPDFYTDGLQLHYTPQDRWFDRQFNLYNHGQRTRYGFGTPGADIKMLQAWDITFGSPSILVSVLDDGLDLLHEDISPSKIVPGYDFANLDPDVQPIGTNAHGTHTSGVIAADHNTIGIAGISPNSRIQMMKIFTDAGGGGTNDNLARAIDSARISGADVLSNSWGYSSSDSNLVPAVRQAIIRAKTLGRGGKGCVIAFSAGNTANRISGNNGTITFPSSMSEVITVGASTRNDEVANYSPNSNPSGNLYIELATPSHRAYNTQIPSEHFEFWSTDISGSLGYNTGTADTLAGDVAGHYSGSMGGTSAACPQVAGAAALILALNPNLTADEVTQVLISSADTVGGYNYNAIPGRPGASLQLGYGRMNTYRALLQVGVNFGWVHGVVTSSGTPLSGVSVDFTASVPQITGSSETNGAFKAAVQVDSLSSSEMFTLRAQKFGYLTFTDTITIVRNDTVTRNIAMTPAPGGTLAVHVFNSDTAGLRANVRVFFAGQMVLNENTDSLTGQMTAPLPVGAYDVVVDPPSPYATRQFPGVQIQENQTTTVSALVRWVVEHSPAAVRDTLPPESTNAKTLTLTNTTPDTVSFQLLTDENTRRTLPEPRIGPMFADESPSKDQYLEVAKHEKDPRFGPRQMAGGGGPDAFGYVWIDSDEPGGPTFNWVDISGTGTALDSTSAWIPFGTNRPGDEGYFPVTLPFAFPYYGSTYTTAYIGTNGTLSFQPPTAAFFTNAAIPTPGGTIDNFIAGFWDDLEVRAAGRVYYGMNGSDFVVQFQDMPRFASGVSNYTFQFILKPNGHILTQYLNMGFGGGTLISATIGIENQNGTIGLQVVFNAAYVHNNLAILYKVLGVDWLEYTPNAGIIPPSSQQNISAEFDAAGIDPGTLVTATTELRLVHPDVAAPILIPTSLQIELVDSAFIVVRPGALEFPLTPIGVTRRDSAKIENGGGTTLTITSMSTTNSDFVVTPTSGTLNPGDSLWIHVDYTPTAAGTDTGRVTIVNNSVNAPSRDVSLSGTSIGVPHFTVAQDSLTRQVEGGVRDSIQFYMRNDGTGTGEFAARAIMFQQSNRADAKPIAVPVVIKPASMPASTQVSDPVTNGYDPVGGSLSKGLTSSGQEPQHYNFNTGGAGNTFPWNVTAGKRIQWIILPGDFSQPSPAPQGRINTLYFRISTAGSGTYTNVEIKMGQTPITALPPGDWYSGPMQTVYTRATVDYSAAAGEWLSIPLDAPFAYDPTQSLVVDVTQCARVGTNLSTFHTTVSGGTRRNASLVGASCPMPFANTATLVAHLGIDVSAGNWFSVNPTQGTVAVGDSILMKAYFDATDPEVYNNPGNYYGELQVVATNSALADTLNVPVRMFVVPPAGPRLAVTPDSLNFGDVEIDSSSTLNVTVRNIGSATLNVTNTTFTSPHFSVMPTNFSLASLDTINLAVRFTAPVPGGFYSAIMNFVSNDPSAPGVRLEGRSVGVSHVAVSPDSFTFSLSGSDSADGTLMIRNTGFGELMYSGSVVGGFIGQAEDNLGSPALNLSTASGLIRGAVVQPSSSVLLTEIRSWLTITTSRELRFVVYQNTTGTSFALIHETVIANSGTGGPQWYSSGTISVTLEAGTRYAIGLNWPAITPSSLTYHWQTSPTPPIPISFGQITGGLAQTVFPPPATLTQGATSSIYTTQIVTASQQWMNIISGQSGTVAYNDSTGMGFRVHSGGLAGGSYNASLRVTTNDPLQPVVNIPVTVDVITGVPDAGVVPEVYALEQNYPNPFNPTTTIQFALPRASNVSLKVYNILGQEVRTLADGMMEAGFVNAVWDGRNNGGMGVSSGIYFYRLDARSVAGSETFHSLKKMVFLK